MEAFKQFSCGEIMVCKFFRLSDASLQGMDVSSAFAGLSSA